MGILVKKKQQGGRLYADPNFIKLNVEDKGGRGPSSQGTNYGAGAVKQPTLDKSKVETEADKLEGLLPSDIAFIQGERTDIENKLAAGYADPNFDSTPAHDALIKRKYDLEILVSQMGAMSKSFHASKTKFQTANAGDAPAIIGGRAIVQVKNSDPKDQTRKFALVTYEDLITNAKSYELKTNQDILTERFNNPDFSGFTQLGLASNQLIEEAYGEQSFNKDFDANLNNVGYIKGKGDFVDVTTKKDIGLGDFVFDEKTKMVIKTNLPQLKQIFNSLRSGDSHITSFLEKKAIANLHKGIVNGNIDIQNQKIDDLVNLSLETQLLTKLRTILTQDEYSKTTADNNNDKDTKDRKATIMSLAAATLLTGDSKVEIGNPDNISDPSVPNLMFKMPTVHISGGKQFLDWGYRGNKNTEDKANEAEDNIKAISNNFLINDMIGGNETDITTFNGTTIESLANGGLDHVKIAANPNMKLTLAPCVKSDDGKWIVDYTNEFTPAMLKAIQATYAEILASGNSQIDIAKADEKTIKKFEEMAKVNLQKFLKPGIEAPEIKAAVAFNVYYSAKSDDIADNPDNGWNAEYSKMSDIASPSKLRNYFTHYGKETVAFVPLSSTFWRDMQMHGAFSSDFERIIPSADYEGIMKSKNEQYGDYIKEMAKFEALKAHGKEKRGTTSKKHGGRLFTDEELTNLLFN